MILEEDEKMKRGFMDWLGGHFGFKKIGRLLSYQQWRY